MADAAGALKQSCDVIGERRQECVTAETCRSFIHEQTHLTTEETQQR